MYLILHFCCTYELKDDKQCYQERQGKHQVERKSQVKYELVLVVSKFIQGLLAVVVFQIYSLKLLKLSRNIKVGEPHWTLEFSHESEQLARDIKIH
jgi:hypothetical protein